MAIEGFGQSETRQKQKAQHRSRLDVHGHDGAVLAIGQRSLSGHRRLSRHRHPQLGSRETGDVAVRDRISEQALEEDQERALDATSDLIGLAVRVVAPLLRHCPGTSPAIRLFPVRSMASSAALWRASLIESPGYVPRVAIATRLPSLGTRCGTSGTTGFVAALVT